MGTLENRLQKGTDMKKFFYGMLLICFALNAAAENVVLVREGIAVSEIILPAKATRSVQMAAFELQHMIHLITGTKLKIVQKSSAGMLPIRLGPAAGEKFTGEQYKVSIRRNRIELAGNDSSDYGKVDYKNARTFPGTGYNGRDTPRHALNYHSTLLAVYEFLESSCGMRFYSFGDEGIAFTKRKTLSVKPMEKRFEPHAKASRYASISYRDSVRVTTERERKLLQLRWRMNTVYGLVNHTTQSIFFRYWGQCRLYKDVFIEKRPQYFVKGYEKTPVDRHWVKYYAPDDPPPSQICTSHPDVAKYFAGEAQAVYNRAAFKKPPLNGVPYRFLPEMEGQPFYYPVQENDNQVFCQCSECRKLFPQIKDFNRSAYIHFDFINKVSREAKKLDPALNIATLAYNKCLAYPDPAILKLDPGIMVQMCLGVHAWMHPRIYRRQHGIYKQWIRNEAKKRPLAVWTYMLSPDDEARRSYKYRNFPMLYPWETGKIYQEFMKDGIQGVFIELCTKVNLLEGYIAMRLAFDPSLDIHKLIDEYFHLYYGEAAQPMKEFYREVESITWNHKNYPAKEVEDYVNRWVWSSVCIGIHTQKVNWTLGTRQRMAKLQKIVDRIKSSAVTPVVKKRVEIFLKDIWERALQGRKEYDQRLLVEKEVPPYYSAAFLPDQKGAEKPDLSRVNWKDIPRTGNWIDLKTRKPLKESPRVQMAFTDHYFLIRYEENSKDILKNGKNGLWRDGLEIFYGNQGNYPFEHYTIGVDGKAAGYRHTLHDGKRILAPLKAADLIFADRKVEENHWSFTVAFPRKGTFFAGQGLKRINFIRNRSCGNPAAWSYIVPQDYASSAFRMGYIQLPERGNTASFHLPAGFGKLRNNRDSFLQNIPSPGKISAVTVSDRKATLFCSTSPVYYMARISPAIRYGDRILCEFTASGKGKGGVGFYLYAYTGPKNVRNQGTTVKTFVSESSPRRYRFVIDTGKLHPKYRNIVCVKPFLMTGREAEITFSHVKFSILSEKSSLQK